MTPTGPKIRCDGCDFRIPVADVVVGGRRRWLLCPACRLMKAWALDPSGDEIIELRHPVASDDADSAAVETFVEAIREAVAIVFGATDLLDRRWGALDDEARRELVGVARRGGTPLEDELLPLLEQVLEMRVPFGSDAPVGDFTS